MIKKAVAILPPMAFYPGRLFLLLLFMCIQINIIAMILAVTLWCVDSGAALKCNDDGLESLLTGQFEKSSKHWRGGQVCECMG